jgi:hypothetical protein
MMTRCRALRERPCPLRLLDDPGPLMRLAGLPCVVTVGEIAQFQGFRELG